jgi:hypothetical protein
MPLVRGTGETGAQVLREGMQAGDERRIVMGLRIYQATSAPLGTAVHYFHFASQLERRYSDKPDRCSRQGFSKKDFQA